MYNDTVWLFGIFIILVRFAVIAFAYFVIKPLQTALAIRKAKKLIASGRIDSQWQFNNVSRMLATARQTLRRHTCERNYKK